MTIVRDTLRGLLTEPNRSLWEGGREGGRREGGGREGGREGGKGGEREYIQHCIYQIVSFITSSSPILFYSKIFHHALLCNSVYYGCHTLPTIFITVIYIHVYYVCTTKSTYPNCAHSGL